MCEAHSCGDRVIEFDIGRRSDRLTKHITTSRQVVYTPHALAYTYTPAHPLKHSDGTRAHTGILDVNEAKRHTIDTLNTSRAACSAYLHTKQPNIVSMHVPKQTRQLAAAKRTLRGRIHRIQTNTSTIHPSRAISSSGGVARAPEPREHIAGPRHGAQSGAAQRRRSHVVLAPDPSTHPYVSLHSMPISTRSVVMSHSISTPGPARAELGSCSLDGRLRRTHQGGKAGMRLQSQRRRGGAEVEEEGREGCAPAGEGGRLLQHIVVIDQLALPLVPARRYVGAEHEVLGCEPLVLQRELLDDHQQLAWLVRALDAVDLERRPREALACAAEGRGEAFAFAAGGSAGGKRGGGTSQSSGVEGLAPQPQGQTICASSPAHFSRWSRSSRRGISAPQPGFGQHTRFAWHSRSRCMAQCSRLPIHGQPSFLRACGRREIANRGHEMKSDMWV